MEMDTQDEQEKGQATPQIQREGEKKMQGTSVTYFHDLISGSGSLEVNNCTREKRKRGEREKRREKRRRGEKRREVSRVCSTCPCPGAR